MNTRVKIAFIFNPISGRKSRFDLHKIIHNYLDNTKYAPEIIETEYAGHAKELVKDCLKKGIKIIIAVGGDGTVNEVASSLHKSGATLGIIPKGSGNGLARSLNIPIDARKAVECINNGHLTTIDIGAINKKFFFCTCGTGFDAKVGHKFSKSKKRGFITYIKTIFREYGAYLPKKYRLKIDGKNLVRRSFLVTVANAGQYGNNAYIAPKAKMNDGKFELCLFKPFPWYTSLFLSFRLFARTIDKSKYIETIQCQSIVFRKKKKYRFHIDGEPVKFNGKVKINIIPAALNVIAP
jgi:diacylglycerol kinase (ATP)